MPLRLGLKSKQLLQTVSEQMKHIVERHGVIPQEPKWRQNQRNTAAGTNSQQPINLKQQSWSWSDRTAVECLRCMQMT